MCWHERNQEKNSEDNSNHSVLRVEGISSSSKCSYEDYEEGGHGYIGPRRKEDIVVGHGYCLEGSKSHYTKDYAKKVEKQPIEIYGSIGSSHCLPKNQT